jgi:1,4-alpha-glucan branching enzyme
VAEQAINAGANPPQEPADSPILTADDLRQFNEGSNFRAYGKFGAHIIPVENSIGARFVVWAPNAERVAVMGSFNGWSKDAHVLQAVGTSGLWEGFVPKVGQGALYKYDITSRYQDYCVEKPDPFGFYFEQGPRGASIVWDLDYAWKDDTWMLQRADRQRRSAPLSIYEAHLGSWMRIPEQQNRLLTYREIADRLVDYVTRLGFTHVEFLPVMEHPSYASCGYGVTHYFAPTSRYGTPQDFMYLIDMLHQAGIGVILDWVPSCFAVGEQGLEFFDGTHLYERSDPHQGQPAVGGLCAFNYDRAEVRSFLVSSAAFWIDRYHADGLRVGNLASMLHPDVSHKGGEWTFDQQGSREDAGAINFLRAMNDEVHTRFPGVQTFAEETISLPLISRPTSAGGLGFSYKWDTGWMNDTLHYFSMDPIHRRYHHRDVTFRASYAFTENFTLPLPHDLVGRGKGSLIGRMPGDDWRKFASMRLMLAYMFAQPGKKLTFMGSEFAQWREWNPDMSLDWHLLGHGPHRQMQSWVSHLNDLYRHEPAMHELDCDEAGFDWVDCSDMDASSIFFLRMATSRDNVILAAFNFTPVPRHDYCVGAPRHGFWKEILNSDATEFGGSGVGNRDALAATDLPCHGFDQSLTMTLPPLGAVFFKPQA